MGAEIVTLGCRLNLSESESLRALLAQENDLVVINSCAVTSEAVRQTRRAIRRMRRVRPEARLLVTGCAAEVERGALAAMPEVDGFVANASKLDPRAWNAPAPTQPIVAGAHTRAFVQVQNGCDHACTFCVIPQGRGPSRSRDAAAVVAEIERREVTVATLTLTRSGNSGSCSISGPSRARSTAAASGTKKIAWGLPTLTATGSARSSQATGMAKVSIA